MEEFYKNCTFEIRVYKTKDMEYSNQVITGDNKLCILTGIASLLQSCLDTKLMTQEELKETVKMVITARKTGARNKVIYNSFERDD